jgi:phytol kinase
MVASSKVLKMCYRRHHRNDPFTVPGTISLQTTKKRLLLVLSLVVLVTVVDLVQCFATKPKPRLVLLLSSQGKAVGRRSLTSIRPYNSRRQQQQQQSSVILPGRSNLSSEPIDEIKTKGTIRPIVLTTAITLLTTCVGAAVTGLLPGYYDTVADGSVLQTNLLLQDVGATLVAGVLGYLFVLMNTRAVAAGKLDPRDARKLIHTFSAPLFMLLWPVFSPATGARFFAATVPILNAVRLYLAGTSGSSNSIESKNGPQEIALAAAVSRSGDAKEAVGGPFIYVVILAVAIVLFWRDSAVGIVALSTLAVGDGMADLVGRRLGSTNKWPNSSKSVAGSLAFWSASTAVTTGLLWWMQYTGCITLPLDIVSTAFIVAGITFASAALEVMPIFGDDNYTVPLSAALLSILFLQ